MCFRSHEVLVGAAFLFAIHGHSLTLSAVDFDIGNVRVSRKAKPADEHACTGTATAHYEASYLVEFSADGEATDTRTLPRIRARSTAWWTAPRFTGFASATGN